MSVSVRNCCLVAVVVVELSRTSFLELALFLVALVGVRRREVECFRTLCTLEAGTRTVDPSGKMSVPLLLLLASSTAVSSLADLSTYKFRCSGTSEEDESSPKGVKVCNIPST